MAAAAQRVPALPTMKECLHTSYNPACDFVGGILEQRKVGEREHSVLQIAIGAWFFNRRKEWKIVVMSEQRTRVSGDSVRVPDLCLVAANAPLSRSRLRLRCLRLPSRQPVCALPKYRASQIPGSPIFLDIPALFSALDPE